MIINKVHVVQYMVYSAKYQLNFILSIIKVESSESDGDDNEGDLSEGEAGGFNESEVGGGSSEVRLKEILPRLCFLTMKKTQNLFIKNMAATPVKGHFYDLRGNSKHEK